MGAGEEGRNTVRCINCEWARKCILSGLTREETPVWKEMLTSRIFQKGQIIFWEDGEAEGLYLLCSGVVKLIKSTDSGDQQIVRLVGPGSFFGLPPLISQRTHFCTCQAVDRTTLQFISRQRFLSFLEQFPRFGFRLIDQLVEELRLARLRLRDFGCKNGRQRMADLLLWLGKEFGRPAGDGVEIGVDLARADLAGIAGLTTETTIRILSSFRQKGMIATGQWKRIVLCDEGRLLEMSGSDAPPDIGIAWPD